MTDQFCVQCGAGIKAHRSFCSDCGAPVTPMAPVAPTLVPPRSEDLDEAELNMTRVRPVGWRGLAAPAAQAPPPSPPPDAFAPAAPAGPAVPPPPPVGPAGPPPANVLPSVGWTVGITFFFGLFGLIPATMHANRARRLGRSGTPYWKAFWVTFVAMVLISIALFVVLILAIAGLATG